MDGVADALLFAVLVDGGPREARVRPDLYLRSGPLLPESLHDALQDGESPAAGVGVAGPQDRRDQLVGLAVEDH